MRAEDFSREKGIATAWSWTGRRVHVARFPDCMHAQELYAAGISGMPIILTSLVMSHLSSRGVSRVAVGVRQGQVSRWSRSTERCPGSNHRMIWGRGSKLLRGPKPEGLTMRSSRFQSSFLFVFFFSRDANSARRGRNDLSRFTPE